MRSVRSVQVVPDSLDFDNPALRSLMKQFQSLLDEARLQGRREAVEEIARTFGDGRADTRTVVRGKEFFIRQRAPRGVSEALTRRALAKGPQTARAIAAMAATDEEKQLSFSAIYLELKRGKKQRRYLNNAGKWSLAPGR
jgi:hypothetical protein